MITKAIIKSRILDSNKYYIRIPYFEQSNVSNNSLTDSFFEATLSQTPGFVNSYNEGDVVFVSFEDHKAGKPVILGKLFLDDDEARGYLKLHSLSVEGDVNLPTNTTIGDFNFKDMYGTLEKINNLGGDFSNIGQDIDDIREDIDELQEAIGNPVEIIDLR